MRVLMLSAVMGLTTPALAQNQRFFHTVQSCGTALQQFEPSIAAGEELLFAGTNVVFDTLGQPFTGGMLFVVNQETGTWSMYTVYGDDTVCTVSFGENFEPN